MDSSSEHLLHVADALYEKGEAPKCAVSLSARSDAAANCRADNVTYTPSIVYDGLGDVLFGQRRSFSATELQQYPDGMMEILVCKANRGCSPVLTRSGSNDDVTFRTINASCKKRIRPSLRS